jgi:hypothetical protein
LQFARGISVEKVPVYSSPSVRELESGSSVSDIPMLIDSDAGNASVLDGRELSAIDQNER